MPRYYFHVDDDMAPPEITGVMLDDFGVAKDFAKKLQGAILERSPKQRAGWSVTVTDERGLAVFEVHC